MDFRLLPTEPFLSPAPSNFDEPIVYNKNKFENVYTPQWFGSLGEGASGIIRRCTHISSKKQFAFKLLTFNQDSLKEISAWKKCTPHPNILSLVDIFSEEYKIPTDYSTRQWIIVVMDIMAGGDMFDEVVKRKRLSEKDARFVSVQLIQAVAHMHMKGICHRDIKLENILLESRETLRIRVCDFGFATGPKGISCKHSPLYASPEILRNGHYQQYGQQGIPYSYLCDIWSVGVCVYILLCGYPPFPSQIGNRMTRELQHKILSGEFAFPSREWSTISSEARDLVSCLLRVEAKQRLTTLAALHHPWLLAETLHYGERLSGTLPSCGKPTLPRSASPGSLPALSLNLDESPLFRRRTRSDQSLDQSPDAVPISPCEKAAACKSVICDGAEANLCDARDRLNAVLFFDSPPAIGGDFVEMVAKELLEGQHLSSHAISELAPNTTMPSEIIPSDEHHGPL